MITNIGTYEGSEKTAQLLFTLISKLKKGGLNDVQKSNINRSYVDLLLK